jgi:hypothetical protein
MKAKKRSRASENSTNAVSFESVLSLNSLRKVWKAANEGLRDALIRDPLDHLAFEAHLDANLRELASSLAAGLYRPAPPTTVRGSKRDGLTRPLSFLEVTDTLVLKGIVDAIQPKLHQGFPSCVAFARSQKQAFVEDPSDYESWIQAWLRHDKTVKKLLEQRGCRFIAKGDVGNFFPTVSHRLLRQMVAQKTGGDEKLLNLLFFVLESMTWRPAYGENREVGLPQENYDASRILAHAFLEPLDTEFRRERAAKRYARWVDDIVVAVIDMAEGGRVLARMQRALEDRGLFLNSAKSKIIPLRNFANALYPKENAYLDRVHAGTARKPGVQRVTKAAFERRLRDFLACEDRYETWDRVLKRYYTESRRMGSGVLESYAGCHLRELPAIAENVLDYLRGRPFARSVLDTLLRYLRSGDNMYEDIEILIYEFLLEWRVPNRQATRVADQCLNHFFGRAGYPNPLSQYARGLMALLAYKYGTPGHMDEIAGAVSTARAHDPWLVRYCVYVLAGTDSHRQEAFRLAERYEHPGLRRTHAFLVSVANNPSSHASLLRKRVAARERKLPDYWYFPARMLPLARLARVDASFRAQWDQHLQRVVNTLKRTAAVYRDERSILLIEGEIAGP